MNTNVHFNHEIITFGTDKTGQWLAEVRFLLPDFVGSGGYIPIPKFGGVVGNSLSLIQGKYLYFSGFSTSNPPQMGKLMILLFVISKGIAQIKGKREMNSDSLV